MKISFHATSGDLFTQYFNNYSKSNGYKIRPKVISGNFWSGQRFE